MNNSKQNLKQNYSSKSIYKKKSKYFLSKIKLLIIKNEEFWTKEIFIKRYEPIVFYYINFFHYEWSIEI